MAAKPRVMHVITSLDTGGAEVMLANLAAAMDRSAFEIEVVSLMKEGPVAERIRDLGIPVHSLGARQGSFGLRHFLRMWKLVRQRRPDLIHAWMYHANVLASAVRMITRRVPLIWAIHVSHLDAASTPILTKLLLKISPRLSAGCEAIVYVSGMSQDLHVSLGFDNSRAEVIANGFDTETFAPDPPARAWLRRELGIGEAAKTVGLVARFHPQKDHANFIAAAGLLQQRMAGVHFVLCGLDVSEDNADLAALIEQAGIGGKCSLLGVRDDVARINAGLDLAATSSAFGEAFPLVIGEAMACGVPCVVTDVGDSAALVGETGRVVPARDARALADAWCELLSLPAQQRQALGAAARQRITDNYSIGRICARYQDLYRRALA